MYSIQIKMMLNNLFHNFIILHCYIINLCTINHNCKLKVVSPNSNTHNLRDNFLENHEPTIP